MNLRKALGQIRQMTCLVATNAIKEYEDGTLANLHGDRVIYHAGRNSPSFVV